MFKRLTAFKEIGILAAFLILCIVTALVNPIFLYTDNMIDVLRSISFTLISAVGMTFVIIGGGLDLSVGSVLALGGMVSGWALVNNLPVSVAILLGMVTGMLLGWFNGIVIVKFRIPALIVTLGTMNIARGAVYVISRGRPFYPFPEAFKEIGQGGFLGIPYVIYIAVLVAAVGHYVLSHTVFGRSVMALGGNEEASRVSGIATNRVKLIVYMIAGVCAALTGILMAARLSSSQAGAGTGWELTVIASVIIGGTSMYGGSGSILGTLIGTAIMTVLTNAMVLMGVSVYWQKIFVGFIIIAAVGIDTYRRSSVENTRG
jgi:ribose/xylose/arabinose/galactoside ABC-type transport system permease subunit